MDNREFEWWGVAADLGLVPDPARDVARLRATMFNAAGVDATPDEFLPRLFDPQEEAEAELAKLRQLSHRIKPQSPPGA